ncbi:amino acid permease [Brettanomyces bruxellensis]|uniref:Amino acid permease n=1 Tax=Dekkera bruxellensis TaxID=5007 RepID=A0A871RCK3_DEKBR|nr:amino acid permease [Brettanomyces bruxellensis]QOU22946.1 amino acid permease [Brettanomyces bruxellensis]
MSMDMKADPEKDPKKGQYEVNITPVSDVASQGTSMDASHEKLGAWTRFKDSFKPAVVEDIDQNLEGAQKSNVRSAKAPLRRKLKNRHLQMIAIGGSIGTGLFVGSGSALHKGGPAALLIDWILTGVSMYCTIQALGELAVAFPISGAFVHYNTRFISPMWGFCIAWNYAFGWCITLPLELVAASLTIDFWNTTVNSAAWVAIFYVAISVINMFGVRGYGEAEFVFSFCKVITIIGFIILGIILDCGGGPVKGYIGGKYWSNPGAFANGFKGVCSVFVTAAFSFGGTELCGLAAAETANPRKSLPAATKQVFWRITLFYVISLTLVGLLVPYNDSQLLNKSSSADAKASPFVIALKNHGIKGLPSVMNAVIMIAVLSVGNSGVFGCSRCLASLAEMGMAPKCFGYIDRMGRPLVGIGIALFFGLLCFLAACPNESMVFTWLMSLAGLSSVFTWGSICVCHLRFRAALKAQGRDTSELEYTSQSGIVGSWFGLALNIIILVAQIYVALFPIGGNPSAEEFFEDCMTIPVLIIFIIFYLIWKRDIHILVPVDSIDLDTGRRVVDIDLVKQEVAEEKAYIKSKPIYYRIYKFWC